MKKETKLPRSTTSGALSSYIRSLKELESLVTKTQTPELLVSDSAPESNVPQMWREVFHMARIAPGLLSCLTECKDLLLTTHAALVQGGSVPQAFGGSGSTLIEEMSNVLEYCEQVIEVANLGAAPVGQTLH